MVVSMAVETGRSRERCAKQEYRDRDPSTGKWPEGCHAV
jgi:hypothetical protein